MKGEEIDVFFPIASIYRLIREMNAGKVSKSAANELDIILEEIGTEIAKRATELAKHASRITVKAEDMRLAFEQWRCRHQVERQNQIPRNNCPSCGTLGDRMYVDFEANQHFPDAFKSLTVVRWFNDCHDLRRCFTCGTYYDCDWVDDNEIFSPTHTGEYKRIPVDDAERMLRTDDAEKRKRKQQIRRKVHELYGAILKTLPEDEMRIINYFINKLNNYVEPAEIEKDLALTKETVENALAHLMQVRVVMQIESSPCMKYALRDY